VKAGTPGGAWHIGKSSMGGEIPFLRTAVLDNARKNGKSCRSVFLPMQRNNIRNDYGATHQNRLTRLQKWAKVRSVAVHNPFERTG
jgi:hypothetical protein